MHWRMMQHGDAEHGALDLLKLEAVVDATLEA